MAKKKDPDEVSPKRADDKKLLEELRDNYKLCVEADRDNRTKYLAALKFCYVPGEQWEASVKLARGPKRITREFNETRVKVKAVVNHIRANRPSAKIRGVEEGDVDSAEAMNGLWLNMLDTSNADDITDFAAETQVAAGMGAWRVVTEYCEDSVSDQDIYMESIRNPLCLYPDYAAKEQDKSDARFWVYHTKLTKTAFEAKYPEAKKDSFEPEEFGTDDPNTEEESVWVAEYWKKVPTKKHLGLLSTGETVDLDQIGALPPGVTVVKDRIADSHKIVQYVCSSTAVLEGPNDWAGKEFPFVIAYGEYVVVDGKTTWYGMTQTMMDAARSHNEMQSSVYETIALSPQAKYWATPEQAKGLQAQWNQAVDENLPIMLYNNDPKAPGPPPRVGAADIPSALMSAAQMSRESLNSVSSVPDANVGIPSNESSGKAIRARQDSGLVGTYNYGDNISKAIGRTCEIFIDLAPKIIDTQRTLRILGKDGAEKYIKVNQFDPVTQQKINDLSKGKYDFAVTQGPNIQTQRQEAAETLSSLAQSDPLLMPTAADIVYRNMDIPGAQEIAERRKMMLPPQILDAINQDKPPDPSVVAAMQQVQQMQAEVQQQGQAVQQAASEAQTEKNAADKAKADVTVASANLKVQEAQLNTQVAQFKQLVAETQANFIQQQSADTTSKSEQKQAESEQQTSAIVDSVATALQSIGQQTAQVLEAQGAQIAQIAQLAAQPKGMTAKTARSKRVSATQIQTVVVDEAGNQIGVGVSERVPGGEVVTTMQPTIQ